MNEKIIMVTGATDGIGLVTANLLAILGHRVIIHGRTEAKAHAVADGIQQEVDDCNIYSYGADLGNLAEVADLAENVLRDHERLDGLINNAGIGPGSDAARALSTDGHELRFQVNYLSLVYLTDLLLPALLAARGRIVNVASAAQEALDLDDLMTEKRFSGIKSYARSKLAVIMYSFDLAQRLEGAGVTVNAMDPGSLLATKMVAEMGTDVWGKAEDGAKREVDLATHTEYDGITGKYYSEGIESRAHEQAYDPAVRASLWTQTMDLLKKVK